MDNIFGNRLKLLRKEKNHITQEEVAKQVNITRATLSRYESGEIEPTINTVIDLAKFFNVSLDWLAGYSDIRDPRITTSNLLELYNSLPGEYKVQAFNFLHYLKFISTNSFYTFKQEEVDGISISTNIPSEADFVSICTDDSLRPLLKKGEFIFLKEETDIKNNDLILISINGTSAIGKIRINKKELKLIPINESYPPVILTDAHYKIIGKIINK